MVKLVPSTVDSSNVFASICATPCLSEFLKSSIGQSFRPPVSAEAPTPKAALQFGIVFVSCAKGGILS